ncbi:MAG: hypothetical protein WBJ17_01900 [Natronincolaceae bacterium]|jgi:hypothetical protein|nr:hypothetical protein [Bacillota bacterium]
MLTMDKIKDIRFRYFVKEEKISHIARELHIDWKTVQKYVDMTDFNKSAPKPAFEQRFCPKLDPYKPTIDQWLEEDKKAPRKQGDKRGRGTKGDVHKLSHKYLVIFLRKLLTIII